MSSNYGEMKKELSQFDKDLFMNVSMGSFTGTLKGMHPHLGKSIQMYTGISMPKTTPACHVKLIVKGILYDQEFIEM